ncbi:MAG: hypothetical protein GPOALKHO_000655 [Sodalis sp.]|nr:MAG: hypothetical protein GPOALKHO_000655 [Sodalis sp.]
MYREALNTLQFFLCEGQVLDALKFSADCSLLDTPTIVEVTNGPRNVQAVSSCDNVWPRSAAIAASLRRQLRLVDCASDEVQSGA